MITRLLSRLNRALERFNRFLEDGQERKARELKLSRNMTEEQWRRFQERRKS